MTHVLVVASTFPASDRDPVPGFVRELVVQAVAADPFLRVTVLAPHDPLAGPPGLTRHEHYDEYRFRYAWPASLQRLAGGGGIVPTLRADRRLYLLVPFFLIAEFLALVRVARRLRPDVVNAHWVIPQGVVAALARPFLRAPIVLTIHGGDVFTFNNALTVALKRFAMRRAARVVVNSSATLARALEIDPRGAFLTTPMGVDVERFDVGERPPLDALRVLFVGRLVEEKGPLDVVEAIILLHRRGVPIEARFVGSGPQREEIERRVRAAGIGDAVRVLGWVSSDDVVEQYRWATAFVGPSVQTASGWVEALGVVFIEASAARLPVITTRAGGTTDIVRDRETGLIVDEGSPAEIADRLAELLARPEFAMRLGEAARAHVRANFAWPPIAHRYAQLFSELDPR